MPKLKILTKPERKAFEYPPSFKLEERKAHFLLPEALALKIRRLKSPTVKVGFALQYVYFNTCKRFFTATQYPKSHIKFMAKILDVDDSSINMSLYQERTKRRHQSDILQILGYKKFCSIEKSLLKDNINSLVIKHIRPKQILISMVDLYHQRKVEIPSYNVFSTLITDAYNKQEKVVLNILDENVTQELAMMLDKLMLFPSREENQSKRAIITFLKHVNQSTRPSKIRTSLKDFFRLKELYHVLTPVLKKLNLSSESARYYATWVYKARVAQVKQFPKSSKRYLHLIAFIVHQYKQHHDALLDTLLKTVCSSVNKATAKQKNQTFETRDEKNRSIKLLSNRDKKSKVLIEDIKNTVSSPVLTDSGKVKQISILIQEREAEIDPSEERQIRQLEKSVDQSLKDEDYLKFLEGQSIGLQRKVSGIIKHVDFNLHDSSDPLFEAISFFKKKEGNIGSVPPKRFIESSKRNLLLDDNGKFRTSLYKILLFIALVDAIKAGHLTLSGSYRYLSLDGYLISQEQWKNTKDQLLMQLGLESIVDSEKVLSKLKKHLDSSYFDVNDALKKGENPYLKFNHDGKIVLTTPAVEKPNSSKISGLLEPCKYTSVVEVLSSIQKITSFADNFSHHSIKHTKGKPSVELFFAGILGLGCNIGTNKVANTSKGIQANDLSHIVTWYFSLENVNAANNSVINVINHLSLPNAFKKDILLLHTSSDGQKKNLSVDSLNANYSFKYHGNGKGVSVYTFIDERCILFHSTVISSSEREAGYVLDGLLHNDEIKTNIHSTDTHGFSEIIFGLTHLLDISFAPRIAKLKDQKLYSFSSRKWHQDRKNEVSPDYTIKSKTIKQYWNEVLRLLVSIKLKQSTASQILNRLSSYSSENPLYKALQEFGRIIKTLFILTYTKDVGLRQSIQKQLNRVELSNRFSNAVFFANNQEFSQGLKEDQEIAVNCKRLIQNSLILWNYLYLSQLVLNTKTKEERQNLLDIIKNGSIMTWQHINMHGEYDFTTYFAKNDPQFDIYAIQQLELA